MLNRDNLGHNQSGSNSQIVQSFPLGSGIFSTGAFWNNTLYMGGGSGVKAFALDTTTSTFNTTPIWQTSAFNFPGPTPSITSMGSANGIVWAQNNNKYCTGHATACGPAVLHAYIAVAPGTEIWNSSQAAGNRDAAGNAVKFTVPTVANGKVYVGTRGNNTGGVTSTTSVPGELDVYGLLPN